MESVYNYKDYREFIDLTLSAPGAKSKIAKKIGCQPAFISRVLKGDAQFSLEQGVMVCNHLGLYGLDKEYFLLILQLDRAGTQELKAYFEEKIQKLLTESSKIKNRIHVTKDISVEEQMKYYSLWAYSAIHILTSIKDFQKIDSISLRLKIDKALVLKYLDFLISCGLVEKNKDRYICTAKKIHANNESPLVNQHHFNMRIKAIDSIGEKKPSDLHFSGIYSLAKDDKMKIREILLESIQKSDKLISDSLEETLVGLCVDFFEV